MHALRVLLVDDEADFTEVLAERMSARGLKVDVSATGPEALERAQAHIYDAVILDMAMPGMSGMETLKRLLANNADLQVIFLTGRATLQNGLDAMRSGAMEFFEKPPNLDKLIDKISEARSRRNQLTDQRLEEAVRELIRRRGW